MAKSPISLSLYSTYVEVALCLFSAQRAEFSFLHESGGA